MNDIIFLNNQILALVMNENTKYVVELTKPSIHYIKY